MEFHEKLQELRKKREITQEELAEALYVSRTAISKWESGRGYPSIDSLKEISNFFSVSIDDLLSSETVLSIAEKENKSNIRTVCNWLLGIVDVCTVLFFVLPLYPNYLDGYVYSVNLFVYTQTTELSQLVYWMLFLGMIASGIVKLIFVYLKIDKIQKWITVCSMILGAFAILFLAMTRVAYATAIAFLLWGIKGILILKIK